MGLVIPTSLPARCSHWIVMIAVRVRALAGYDNLLTDLAILVVIKNDSTQSCTAERIVTSIC